MNIKIWDFLMVHIRLLKHIHYFSFQYLQGLLQTVPHPYFSTIAIGWEALHLRRPLKIQSESSFGFNQLK